jgi:uncharacterized membrane protein YiaA
MKNPIVGILISAILFALVAGIVVAMIGLVLGWKTYTQFSDGFFVAGAILLGIGLISYQGYSQGTSSTPPCQGRTHSSSLLTLSSRQTQDLEGFH